MIELLLSLILLCIAHYYFFALPRERNLKQIQIEMQCASLGMQFFEILKKSNGWNELDMHHGVSTDLKDGTYARLINLRRGYSRYDFESNQSMVFVLTVDICRESELDSGEQFLRIYDSQTGKNLYQGFSGNSLNKRKLTEDEEKGRQETEKMIEKYIFSIKELKEKDEAENTNAALGLHRKGFLYS